MSRNQHQDLTLKTAEPINIDTDGMAQINEPSIDVV
jgi:hypothetical protein